MPIFAVLTPLAQVAAAVRDTLLVRPLPPVRSAFEQVVFVVSGVTSLLMLVLAALLVAAALSIRKSVKKAHTALDRRLDEFGHRVDDFNQLLGRMHTQGGRVVDLASAALTTVEWGADTVKKLKTRRRRRRPGKESNVPPDSAPSSASPDSDNTSR